MTHYSPIPIDREQIDRSTLALSLAVLGIPGARVDTPAAARLYNQAAGEKVRLTDAATPGRTNAFRARQCLERLAWAVENTWPAQINGPNPELTALHWFLRDYAAQIDDICWEPLAVDYEPRVERTFVPARAVGRW